MWEQTPNTFYSYKKDKITQNHNELKKANIFQNRFGSIQFKFKSISVSNDV